MKKSIIFILVFSIMKVQAATFGIIGDAGDWNKNAKKVRNSMLEDSVMNLIMPGDNLYDTSLAYHDVWKHWSDKGFNYTAVAIGNHNRSHAEEVEYFKLEGEYFTKVVDSTRFIVLNSNNVKTASEQAAFLKTTLQNANEAFIFVVFHHPPFSLRHTWQERAAFHLATRPILQANSDKITALLVGHDHVASYVEMDSLPVVLSGAVMESLNIPPVNRTEEGRQIKTKWSSAAGQFYWTRLDVNPNSGEAWINFVRSDVKEVSCTLRLAPRPVKLLKNCK